MSLSAKERILKLRETEFKLQKLQNDLLNGNNNGSATMSEFLAHHKELMALPGSNRDSLPFRFSFEAPGRYIEVKKTQKLTLPPKIPAKSVSKLKPFKDTDDSDKNSSSYKFGVVQHRSAALQSLLTELDKQTSKMAVAFPKFDKYTVLNKSPFTRGQLNRSAKRYIKANSTKFSGGKGLANNKSGKTPRPLAQVQSKKVKLMWNNEISETASTATASELLLLENEDDKPNLYDKKGGNDSLLHQPASDEELRDSVAYALGTSNLMGVILPSSSPSGKRGPDSWEEKNKQTSSNNNVDINNNVEEDESFSAKEAVTVLRRRKFPERKSPFPKLPSPHERGLIGVEISNFEPQCAFFYRDRNGNYNPHLHHSKNVTESMRNRNLKWNKQ